MEFILFDEKQKEKHAKRLYEILSDSDEEFVPPLSKRSSTTQSVLNGQGKSHGIDDYFAAMMMQEGLGIFIDGELCGYISFIKDYRNEEIAGIEIPNLYISTVILTPSCRGKNVTRQAYGYLFYELFPDRTVYTRTWSTNFAHIKILRSFAFSQILVKANDRGAGTDTVYFQLKR